jgi:hypothetical protein
MVPSRNSLLVIVIFTTSGLLALAAYSMLFQQAQGQAHGNQGLSKYIITEEQVNNLTAAMNSAFGEPFYVLGNSQDLSSQVLKTNPLETQDTYRVNGTMKGVGNISETGTYVSTYRPGTLHSVGSGTLSTSNGTATATFTAADQGQQDANGNLLYKGIVFYRAEPTGKLGFLDNKIGLYVYWQNTSGNDWSKVWEWK